MRGSNDTPLSVKIFPPREFSSFSVRVCDREYICSEKHLYLVEHAFRDDKNCNLGPRSASLYTIGFPGGSPVIDPYINSGQAHGEVFSPSSRIIIFDDLVTPTGLCFSVPVGIPVPPSLKNVSG